MTPSEFNSLYGRELRTVHMSFLKRIRRHGNWQWYVLNDANQLVGYIAVKALPKAQSYVFKAYIERIPQVTPIERYATYNECWERFLQLL